MNVLSLFDGMSCGQLALERAGIKVDNYFASEVDKYAIKIAMKNYPNTIQLGDVRNVHAKDLPRIDLILAGSPCQGFSIAGKGLAFDDPRSVLFFEFVRLVNELPESHFVLENVKMKKIYRDMITFFLKTAPVMINSALVSGQNRPRLYWSSFNFPLPENKGIDCKDIINWFDIKPNTDGWHKWWENQKEKQLRKSYCGILNTRGKSICQTSRQMATWAGNLVDLGDGKMRFASPIECERLQTVPDNYTLGVSKRQRYKMLGNGWTADVVAHILRHLPT